MYAGNCSTLRTNKITTNKSNRKTQKHKLIHSKKNPQQSMLLVRLNAKSKIVRGMFLCERG